MPCSWKALHHIGWSHIAVISGFGENKQGFVYGLLITQAQKAWRQSMLMFHRTFYCPYFTNLILNLLTASVAVQNGGQRKAPLWDIVTPKDSEIIFPFQWVDTWERCYRQLSIAQFGQFIFNANFSHYKWAFVSNIQQRHRKIAA